MPLRGVVGLWLVVGVGVVAGALGNATTADWLGVIPGVGWRCGLLVYGVIQDERGCAVG